jgi:hypothetical protein
VIAELIREDQIPLIGLIGGIKPVEWWSPRYRSFVGWAVIGQDPFHGTNQWA